MSRSRELTCRAAPLALAAALAAGPALSQEAALGLGREALPEEIAAWDIDVRPDGLGLPEGEGSVMDGETLYIDNCATCHGDFGEAVGRWPVLAGGQGTLTRRDPNKTIGSYWPYLSTVYDYVHRAMPFGNAQSLTDDEVYAITAYLLYLNDLVDEDFVLSKATFGEVEMPNADGFIPDDRETVEMPLFIREPCMENCKESVEITGRAAILDVTPDVEGDEPGAASDEAAAEPKAEPEAETEVAAVEPAAEEPAADETATEETATEETAGEETAAAPAEEAHAAVDPALAAEGEKLFRQCAACHQVGEGAKNRVGPALNGIVGAPAAAVNGFRYSNALVAKGEEGLVWSPEALAAFLEKPRDYVPGTKMTFAGLRNPDDAAAITAYLASFGE